MKYLIVLMALVACGITVTHKGTVTHKIELDVGEIVAGFEEFCTNAEPDNVEACTDKQIADFIRTLVKNQKAAEQ